MYGLQTPQRRVRTVVVHALQQGMVDLRPGRAQDRRLRMRFVRQPRPSGL